MNHAEQLYNISIMSDEELESYILLHEDHLTDALRWEFNNEILTRELLLHIATEHRRKFLSYVITYQNPQIFNNT
jgi:hypothetical protein